MTRKQIKQNLSRKDYEYIAEAADVKVIEVEIWLNGKSIEKDFLIGCYCERWAAYRKKENSNK